MKNRIKKIAGGLAITCILWLSGCGVLVWDSDTLIVTEKRLVEEGFYMYTIEVNGSPDITYKTTNSFEVGESLKFVGR